jgi:acetyl-CoA C-acetyltransferase
MPEAVIVSACRTAIGTAFKGSLTETSAFDLADAVVSESVARTGLRGDDVDDVILGETLYGGGAIARHAAITAGLTGVPGMALNRHCASGLSAVTTAAANIKAGMANAVIAGGVHSQSTSPKCVWRIPGTQDVNDYWISPTHPDRPDAPNMDMSITVGWNAAVSAGLTREELDAWALESHRKAVAAADEGRFADEIVPIKVTRGDGTTITFDADEHPRRDTTAERLAGLKPLHPEIDGFSITAGNAGGLNDGAAALVVTSDAFASSRGLTPLAVVRSWASVAVDPAETGLAPTKAIPKALSLAGLQIGDVGLFEINEAFASVPVATVKQLGIDPARVNPSGSGCSLGHPVAATGARMLTTLVHELRRRGGGIGVASMCAGGGMGTAVVIEVAAP